MNCDVRKYRVLPFSVHRDVPSAVSAKEIQWCIAFHHTTGAKMARATARPRYGSRRPNHRRPEGEHNNHSPTESGRTTATYLLWRPNPNHTPATSHGRTASPFPARHAQSSVMTQQRNQGP